MPPYGPLTPLVRDFLQRLAGQPPMAWLAASRRYAALATTPAGRQADRALGAAITASAREEARDAVVGPIVQMASRAADGAAVAGDDAVQRLAEPALAAALALLVADRLDPTQRQVLTQPFAGALPDLDRFPPAATGGPGGAGDDAGTPRQDPEIPSTLEAPEEP